MMNKFKKIITCMLVCVLVSTGVVAPVDAASFPSETNAFGKDYLVGQTDQNAPFFEKVLPSIAKNIKTNNKHSINPYFDELPKANNSNNFQGLGTTSYANINGKTVTAEGFYRIYGDSLHDPNAGMGLLIYQCIQYKLAHPEEDVEIRFSTYRTSATAAVCVLPQSKYYGYMRSLHTTNYDEHGFVRISYMLTEAARMGIKVSLINQLPSYKVKQYNPETKKTASRKLIHYKNYFNAALKTDCYDKYAQGKKVSDFMDFIVVDWEDYTMNMQHVKTCTVSHYKATNGTEHTGGVFFTTGNLDENDYLGRNGNEWSQTGVILSDHDDIYRVTVNYYDLMKKYSHQEGIQELRKIVTDRNEEQSALIKSGKGSEIAADEQIVYLGTKTDKVFKLYFTPLAGGVDTWDVDNNPICEYIDKLTKSEGYIEFAWNEYGFESNTLGKTIGKMLEKAFCQNKNKNNKISIKVDDINLDKIKALSLGKDIKYRLIKNGNKMHAKDFFLNYVENGSRHKVSIMTSCNLVTYAFHYRTNSILVIDETTSTGGNFYEIMTPKYSDGVITNAAHQHKLSDKVIPATLKANGKKVSVCTVCGKTVDVKATYYSPKTFKLSTTTYTYNKDVRKPSVTVKDSKGKTLKKDTDYTVKYESGRKYPGKYAVTVTFKGKYSGTKKLYFKIKPRVTKSISATSTMTTATLSWTKVTGADGYRIYKYSSAKDKYVHIASVTSGTKYKATKLKSKGTYKFKVRAYTKDDGDVIWGGYSTAKSVKTK